mgnify:FL=1
MVFTLTAFRAKTLFAPLVLGMALFAAPAGASTGDEAKAFVEDVSQQAIDIISDKDASKAEREAEFRALLAKTADMDNIAAFALGQYLRTPTLE